MKRSHVDVTAEFGNIEILPHRCLARVTVVWPRMWLMDAKILPSVLCREMVVSEFSDQLWALVQCWRHHCQPLRVLFLIVVYLRDLEELSFFLHVVASPKR